MASLLRVNGDLKPFSLVSRAVRDFCKPTLFRRVKVNARWLACHPGDRIPQTVWPHVTLLRLHRPYSEHFFPPGYEEPVSHVSKLLRDTLCLMPRLHTVLFTNVGFKGVPWKILDAVLSTSTLLSFKANESLDHVESIPDDIRFTIPPLRHFVQLNNNHYRLQPRASLVEQQLSASVVEQASTSLESVALSSEAAPSLEQFRRPWPNLRELTLQGERRRSPTPISPPIVSLFTGMPRLHVLVLEFALPPGSGRECIWPANIDAHFPWPELRTLSVAYPHPDDQIYSHLPVTLRSLTLRCYPRHYVHQLWPNLGSTSEALRWQSPILASSELLKLLRSARSPHVTDLDIEYQQDDQEMALLEFLPLAYPNLTQLTLHRYRAPDSADIDVAELARLITPLDRLRVLRLHLDFSYAPHPFTVMMDYGREKLSNLIQKTDLHAGVLARMLAPSLKVVCFLRQMMAANTWTPYRILIGPDGERTARGDLTVAKECNIRLSEPSGPAPASSIWSE
ncbi:hypothetical protein BD413DRAFT_241782 [Trametes elegans]|nr:hypothetical protein BD413DRAFT_241782 [Trametes elegans]